MSQIEVVKAALQMGAGWIGVANEHAQRTGNQSAEMADHFERIAQGVKITLEGIAAAVQCSKAGIESSRGATRALEDARASFRSVGFRNESFVEMTKDVGAYLTNARAAQSNMSHVEGALGKYVPNLEFLGKMATGNVEIFRGQAELMSGFSGEIGPDAQCYAEGQANRL